MTPVTENVGRCPGSVGAPLTQDQVNECRELLIRAIRLVPPEKLHLVTYVVRQAVGPQPFAPTSTGTSQPFTPTPRAPQPFTPTPRAPEPFTPPQPFTPSSSSNCIAAAPVPFMPMPGCSLPSRGFQVCGATPLTPQVPPSRCGNHFCGFRPSVQAAPVLSQAAPVLSQAAQFPDPLGPNSWDKRRKGKRTRTDKDE